MNFKTLAQLASLHASAFKGLGGLQKLLRLGKAGNAESVFAPFLRNQQRHAAGLVALTQIALAQGKNGRALLLADRLRRVSPQDGVAWALAGATSLGAGLTEDSIQAYGMALGIEPDRIDFVAGLSYALLAAGRPSEALLLLEKLLKIGPDKPVTVELALDIQLAGDQDKISICYFSPDGKLNGLAWDRNHSSVRHNIELVSNGQVLARFKADKRSNLLRRKGIGDGDHAFHIAIPEGITESIVLRFASDHVPLIGSPLTAPPRISGWLNGADGRYVVGSVNCPQAPEQGIAVAVHNSIGQTRIVLATPIPQDQQESGRRGNMAFLADFGEPPPDILSVSYDAHFELSGIPLQGSPLQAVVGPNAEATLRALTQWFMEKGNATKIARIGLPVNLHTFLRRNVLPLAHQHNWHSIPKQSILPIPTAADTVMETIVDVIIPIYRGRQETLDCIESVLTANNLTPSHLILIDDASPDAVLSATLESYANRSGITLLRNAENLGFVRSINRAIAVHPHRDVILLNSDTRVHGDWLDRLMATAGTDPRIGTITPLSNDATICSYPAFNAHNPFPDSSALASIDALCAGLNPAEGVTLPTGVGFCMFIRRACLDDAGGFDAVTWGRGYGEENDLCMRATYLGWQHVAATQVYVAHHGGTSFGIEGSGQLQTNLKKLNALHPGYNRLVQEFLLRDPLQTARRRLDLARIRNTRPVRSILLVTHGLGGGTERHVRELADTLCAGGITSLILRPAGNGRVRLDVPKEWACPNLIFDPESELDELIDLFRCLNVAHLHYHHFIDIPDSLVFSLPDLLNLRYHVTIHDYSWLCPQVNLIDATGLYCGEPDIQTCEGCLRTMGSRLPQIGSVQELRKRSSEFLAKAQAVIAPTTDTARRIQRFFSGLAVAIRPHPERDVEVAITVRNIPDSGRLRIAVIGAIGNHKGYRQLIACAEDAAARQLPIEFLVFGNTADDMPLFQFSNVFVTGPYQEEELRGMLDRFRCDAALFLSVWPETWSYTLSAALAGGLLPFAYDIGAFGERIREAKIGVLFPLTLPAREINDLMQKALTIYRSSAPKRVRLGQPGYGEVAAYYGAPPASRKKVPATKTRRAEPRTAGAMGAS